MKDFSKYTQAAADWRHQLRVNERRSFIVMLVFVLIYVMIGVIIDLYLHPQFDRISLYLAIKSLATFRVFPMATITLSVVAIFSVLVTFTFHDRLILLGSKHREINPKTAQNLSEQKLYNVTEELKIAAGLHYMPKIYLIEAPYMNAFASGYSEKSALIAITTGLLKKLDRSELQAVIAHELSHIRHHDIKLTLMASVLSNIILIVLDIMFRSVFFRARGRRRGGGNAIILIIVLLRFVLPVVTMLLILYLSRKRELMADAGAVELMRDNNPMAKALLKISKDHEANKNKYKKVYSSIPHEEVRREAYLFDPTTIGISMRQSITGAFSTHPPMEERLKALGFVWKGKEGVKS